MIQWQTKAGNITTNFKVEVDFTLPALSTTNVLTWKCDVDNSARGRYNMFLGRDLLTELLLNPKKSEHLIEAGDGPFMGSTSTMVDLGLCVFEYLTEKN